MARMPRPLLFVLLMLTAARGLAAPEVTEEKFRVSMGFGPAVHMMYRDPDCKPVDFRDFANAMSHDGAHADVDRATDGSAVTITVKMRGATACPSPYPPVTEMPAFDLKDLAGKRVTAASLRGKPTLMSFFFSTCLPCILEVQPINHFAAARPKMNFLAVTFDPADTTRGFVKTTGLRWHVVPDAQEFIERMRVKQYPLMVLFDADGRLLGTKKGGATDELEAANVEAQLKRWVDGLLKK
jgi:peroxiredoxin